MPRKTPAPRVYNIWGNMKQRCLNPNSQYYHIYGGRGISICEEWRNSSKAFIEWALSNGYDDNLTIDRIDVNGNYEPSNCRWATQKEQNLNTRRNVFVTINGETKTATEWCEEHGINIATFSQRVRLGYEGEELLQPLVDYRKGVKNQKIIELLKRGKRNKEIMEIVGCSKSYVCAVKKKNKI